MANPLCEVLLTKEPLGESRAIVDLGCGATVDFRGIVRALEADRQIDGIEYEAHAAMAEHQLRTIAQQAISDFALLFVSIHHRIGLVPAGETSLLLRVGSAHRGAAFEASQWIVTELKKRVPIWKMPRYTDGDDRRGTTSPATMVYA
jgi:molybdopterin synthase catalytic subunit